MINQLKICLLYAILPAIGNANNNINELVGDAISKKTNFVF